MAGVPPLNRFKAASFDIYGTLIDWEAGIVEALQPFISQLPKTHPCAVSHGVAVAAFMRHEKPIIKENPTVKYHEALKEAARRLAEEWGLKPSEAQLQAVPDSVANWKAFPDTVAAMQALSKHYKLIALSNCSYLVFGMTKAGPLKDVRFDGIYLAEDIGSYKPSPQNFEYLLSHVQEDFGLTKDDLLHVGHGAREDMVPSWKSGICNAWIERGVDNWAETRQPESLRAYKTLGALAQDVEASFAGK